MIWRVGTRNVIRVPFDESRRIRPAGLEQADSVVSDARKMLFVPALCAFFRNREHASIVFQQNAPYIFDPTTHCRLRMWRGRKEGVLAFGRSNRIVDYCE